MRINDFAHKKSGNNDGRLCIQKLIHRDKMPKNIEFQNLQDYYINWKREGVMESIVIRKMFYIFTL
jgi:hypothetical protein